MLKAEQRRAGRHTTRTRLEIGNTVAVTFSNWSTTSRAERDKFPSYKCSSGAGKATHLAASAIFMYPPSSNEIVCSRRIA